MMMAMMLRTSVAFIFSVLFFQDVYSFNIADYTHYLDYLPYRQEGFAAFEDFRTAPTPPTSLRNRKMEVGGLKIQVEDVLANPTWPSKWPYSSEDFRPLDYTRDIIINTGPQYTFSQSLIDSDHISLIPGFFRVPIRRHFVFPKDKFALSEHLDQYIFKDCRVLELFSCYESILPDRYPYETVVGVGWNREEMKCNQLLDDFIEQDISIDPFLPLKDNYFDFVVVPAMFQLVQRPKDLLAEVNRVLKPGGTAVFGVKLAMWSFLGWKQGRYFAETNYLEDILAMGSFFHYAGGYTKPEAFDLNLPELNAVGKLKDALFPQPRLDFYACVQARKRKDSLHGRRLGGENNYDPDLDRELDGRSGSENEIEGARYQPKVVRNPLTKEERLGPYY